VAIRNLSSFCPSITTTNFREIARIGSRIATFNTRICNFYFARITVIPKLTKLTHSFTFVNLFGLQEHANTWEIFKVDSSPSPLLVCVAEWKLFTRADIVVYRYSLHPRGICLFERYNEHRKVSRSLPSAAATAVVTMSSCRRHVVVIVFFARLHSMGFWIFFHVLFHVTWQAFFVHRDDEKMVKQ